VPVFWSPIFEVSRDSVRTGFTTSGHDLLGYHGYSIAATWLVSAKSRVLAPGPATPDWRLSYSYDRWRPTISATASEETLFSAGQPDSLGRPTDAVLRQREIELGVVFPIRHVRTQHVALASVLHTSDEFRLGGGTFAINRQAMRLGWASNTSRTYGYSISAEDGVTVGAAVELARPSEDLPDASSVSVDGRTYFPGLRPRHVVAIQQRLDVPPET
jgi:hypothetical protein